MHYKLVIKDGYIIKKQRQKRSMFKPIPLILTVGLLYHKYYKGKIIKLYFSYYPDKKIVKLSYLLTTSDIDLHNFYQAIKYLESFGKDHSAQFVETNVVNPFLSPDIMERCGWKFVKRKRIIGRVYHKKIS